MANQDKEEMSKWHKFTGRYIKRVYEVRLKNGDIVQCWPNAGKMTALDGSGRQFTEEDNIEIRPQKGNELDD
jgi:hypothetical protein